MPPNEIQSPTGTRGADYCRACSQAPLVSVLDLGRQPLANRLLPSADADATEFPLHLRICPSCYLGQVADVVAPEEIFQDYPYLSSVSSSWLDHSREYARKQTDELRSSGNGFVIEIASNDGYLLKIFNELGLKVLGVEPAENVAAVARAQGVETLCAFFGTSLAADIVSTTGSPDLVVANNVFAHVPDIVDFARGLHILCNHATRISIENPSFTTLLLSTQFDTIYHEHFSYLSAHAVKAVASLADLQLFDVETLPTHGGSYRYWLSLPGAQSIAPTVALALEREATQGLKSPQLWQDFALRSREVIADLDRWFSSRSRRRLAAYGAAAKGNTLLNAVGLSSQDLQVVFDNSPEKIGKFLPGSGVPVSSSNELKRGSFDDVLILPWNIASEIAEQIQGVDQAAHLWRAIPRMERVF